MHRPKENFAVYVDNNTTLTKAISGKALTMLEWACSDDPPGMRTPISARGPIMSMHHTTLGSLPLLSPSQIADLRLAASHMTGSPRRAFEAEMTVKYCGGNPLRAEAVLGWGRQTVALGLAERRTGIICLGAQSAFSGRKRWEEQHPQAAQALRQLADAHAQQDPTFRTSLTYTRLTAQAALKALEEQG